MTTLVFCSPRAAHLTTWSTSSASASLAVISSTPTSTSALNKTARSANQKGIFMQPINANTCKTENAITENTKTSYVLSSIL